VIHADLLSKLYGSDVYALRDISMTVGKGEFVFLTGPSGAGKTTLLRLLVCQERPTAGRLVVAGRDLATLTKVQVQAYRRAIGFVFQDFKLIPGKTVFENVIFVPRILGFPDQHQIRRTYQVLKWVGLQHCINAYPAQISGGEQQRVAIARALACDPPLLVGDEPTGNLDTSTAAEMFELLARLNDDGKTVLYVTHDPVLAARAPRTVTIRDGLVVEG
jgi:cell division transport system ATP-binding protein